MLGEQYRKIQELRRIADEEKKRELDRQFLASSGVDTKEIVPGVTKIIYEILEDYLGNDP